MSFTVANSSRHCDIVDLDGIRYGGGELSQSGVIASSQENYDMCSQRVQSVRGLRSKREAVGPVLVIGSRLALENQTIVEAAWSLCQSAKF
jgi:hypothetical protein